MITNCPTSSDQVEQEKWKIFCVIIGLWRVVSATLPTSDIKYVEQHERPCNYPHEARGFVRPIWRVSKVQLTARGAQYTIFFTEMNKFLANCIQIIVEIARYLKKV